jgi:alpha-tubulin suppressor-like RCC1 family protein
MRRARRVDATRVVLAAAGRVSCGSQFAVAVSRAGELWSWGECMCGQLGVDDISRVDIPSRVCEKVPCGGGCPYELWLGSLMHCRLS